MIDMEPGDLIYYKPLDAFYAFERIDRGQSVFDIVGRRGGGTEKIALSDPLLSNQSGATAILVKEANDPTKRFLIKKALR
jgi:hypothetical protein